MDLNRTAALEAWLGTIVEKGAPHKLGAGGPPAVSIVAAAARAIVEEDGGHASPKACAPGGEWGQARQLARKFSEAAHGPDHLSTVYSRGCVEGLLLLRGGDTASEGRAAVEGALRVLKAPPHSLPDPHPRIAGLNGWLASAGTA